MRAWQLWFLCFVVLNADAQKVTSLEEDLADAAFGEFTFTLVHINESAEQ